MTGKKSGFDPAELRGKLLSKNAVTADGERLVSFSQGTPEYYANLTYAETVKDFIEEIRALFAWRMEGTANNILPVDSYFLFTKMQDELGMRTFMPEVGCQIPLMRQAVALARGTARAKERLGVLITSAGVRTETRRATYAIACPASPRMALTNGI